YVPLSAGTKARMAEKAAKAEAEAKEAAKQAAKIQPAAAASSEPVKIPGPVVIQQSQAQVQEPVQKKMAVKHAAGPKNYVGQIETYKARGDDTLQSIGEANDLGYVEIRSANPTSDPWKPGAGTFMILPKMHLLPDAPRKGIVINLSEMRLYYYPADGGEIRTFPIGVGREGFTTPIGSTTVVRKTIGPVWRPTDRMRREDPRLPAAVGAGPDNPLGTHALYLGWPQYLLHGTNKPWGIGRRVSSGCVRMYNSSAEELYNTVPVGTPVMTVRQPVKFGWINDMLYIEAHPDEMLADQAERSGGGVDYKVPADIFANLSRAAGKDARERIDWRLVREALRERKGYPVPILQGAKEDDYFVTAAMEARVNNARYTQRVPVEDLRQMPIQPVAQQAEPAQTQEASVPENTTEGSTRRKRLSRFN
ncbi:MAG TPA: L,D-transpeptidase family protein, partial [Alphaproteobacteria bacterium]